MTITNKKSFLLYFVIIIFSIVVVNVLFRNIFFRLDLTANKMYSLSDSSKLVVDKIDDLLTLKVYFSDDLPDKYGNNRRYLQDILEEYEAFSHGNIHFEFYKPEDSENLASEAQKYGIQPVQLQVVENDKLEIKKVYMGMVFIYEDQREIIPVIQTTTGLEYDITTKIKKLVDTQKRTLAVAKFEGQVMTNDNITQLLRQSYNVKDIKLDTEIPNDISLLLVNGVEDSVSENEISNLKQFVAKGGNLFVTQSKIKADLQTLRGSVIQSNFFDVLGEFGLAIDENVILDKQCGQVTVSQNVGIFRMNSAVDYPFFPLIQNFGDHLIVDGLEQIRILFPSSIVIDNSIIADSVNDVIDANITPLFYTSDKSATMSGYYNLSYEPKTNPVIQNLNEKGKAVAVLAAVETSTSTWLSQIVLVADSKFLSDDGGGSIQENSVFVMNTVDYLMGDSDLIALRSREITTRPLEAIDDELKSKLKWMNILLPSLLIISLGFFILRKESNRAKILGEIYEQK
ncbi:MAG: GldG family protein [Candidatus Marinimicrobia bacterium]|nr:GldG family protein [Candidatus Neomarinimicrobiota bacterium]MBL7109000.1 GldG family protein [Candidatus Neomarinimicrobiota bacterium]